MSKTAKAIGSSASSFNSGTESDSSSLIIMIIIALKNEVNVEKEVSMYGEWKKLRSWNPAKVKPTGASLERIATRLATFFSEKTKVSNVFALFKTKVLNAWSTSRTNAQLYYNHSDYIVNLSSATWESFIYFLKSSLRYSSVLPGQRQFLQYSHYKTVIKQPLSGNGIM